MAQDFLDDGGSVDETDHFQAAGTTAAEQRVGFIHPLDQPSPRALSRARTAVRGNGAGRRTDRWGTDSAGACAAHMGPLPVVMIGMHI